MRLDKALANSGFGSRSEVKDFIRSGRVSLAGEILRDPAASISQEQASLLCLDGEILTVRRYLYYLLNKPAGLVTAMNSREANIGELLPVFFGQKKITPVGRLDKDTTGLLLLTNHGELQHRLLSPRYGIPRRYYVEVQVLDHPFNDADVEQVAIGVRLNDAELSRPANLAILSPTAAYLELREGKFHEVKRMMHALGKEVTKLHRESYGSVRLHEEVTGSLRALTEVEILGLLASVRLLDPLD